MHLSLLLGGAVTSLANAATITITRTHQAVCPATSSRISWSSSPTTSSGGPPSASPSVSVDEAINGGAPFRINITPYTPGKVKRQVPPGAWLKVDGYLTSNPSEAATFVLNDGQLAGDGWLESTSYEIERQIFAGGPDDSLGPITRLFEVENGAIHWYAGTFDQGEARFYYAKDYVPPPPELNKRQSAGDALMVVFTGDPAPEWTQISMSGSCTSCNLTLQVCALTYLQ